LYTNAFEQTKIEANLISKVEVTGPLLAGLALKKTGAIIVFNPSMRINIPAELQVFGQEINFV
jgi:hypothetical protein